MGLRMAIPGIVIGRKKNRPIILFDFTIHYVQEASVHSIVLVVFIR